jgi:hypothetical protein
VKDGPVRLGRLIVDEIVDGDYALSVDDGYPELSRRPKIILG